MTKLHIHMPASGYSPGQAASALVEAGLVDALGQAHASALGPTALAQGALEALREAVDLSMAASEGLRGLILESLAAASAASHRAPSPWQLPPLEREHRQLLGAFAVIVLADASQRALSALVALPPPEGELELDGLPELLGQPLDAQAMCARALKLALAYARHAHPTPSPDQRRDAQLIGALGAFLQLLRRAALTLSRQSAWTPLVRTLEGLELRVGGHPYRGLEVRQLNEQASGLLPVRPEQIVGNDAFLQAGLRLARDVAAYDLELGRGPKRVNPVLFGLGKPGCGKTVTAHAIGNYFLDYCSARGVPARFLVIQRTDWASSYQNASASNLVRIFREEVYAFEGVCGVYWPDIDTAFASRDSGQLRAEEKQNLGAAFGVFDGTLLPKDGKWFMICDANTMHMDEATVSRIAQNPMTVQGPTTAAHYATMMRELMLKDVSQHIELDERGWLAVGQRALALGLSGRNVEAICNNLRALIQDFELPEAYFRADAPARRALIDQLSVRASAQDVHRLLDEWATFHLEAERREEEARFSAEVEQLVRRLNATELAQRLRFGQLHPTQVTDP